MTVSIVMWSLLVFAVAQSTERTSCPEGYTLVGSECVNTDGDVVEPQ